MRYFIDAGEEITVRFACGEKLDDLLILDAEQKVPEGYEENWMRFHIPGWEEEAQIYLDASLTMTDDGAPVVNALKLSSLRIERLLRAWSFARPIEAAADFDFPTMLRIAQRLEQEIQGRRK